MACSVEKQSSVPNMLWGQNDTNVFLTIKVDNPIENTVKLVFESDKLLLDSFSLTRNTQYNLNMNLSNSIDIDQSKYIVKNQSIECVLSKKNEGLWNTLTKNKQYKYHIEVDWDKWTDENIVEEPSDMGDWPNSDSVDSVSIR